MKKIGLFGGSFNPIHQGHMSMARLACDFFQLDQMFIIPAGEHPFAKKSLTVSAKQRAEMVELAIENEPLFSLYRGEIDREGTSFAYDTIFEIAQANPESEIYYLIGADNLSTFDKWHRYEEILEIATLMVASRPGYSEETTLSNVKFFPSPQWGLSSSVIRSYLSEGLSCRYLLHDSIIEYFSKNKLYV